LVVLKGVHELPESMNPDGQEPTFGNDWGCAAAAAIKKALTVSRANMNPNLPDRNAIQ
jgi:hypothetical protein